MRVGSAFQAMHDDDRRALLTVRLPMAKRDDGRMRFGLEFAALGPSLRQSELARTFGTQNRH